MDRVQEILDRKNTSVVTVGEDATVLEAAVLMNEHAVGALMVVEGANVLGVVSERDVLRGVVAARGDPAQTPVSAIMTSPFYACGPETTLTEAREVMRSHRVRHLPVIGDGERLLGIISLGDLNAWKLDEARQTIEELYAYLYTPYR
jgi:CBS domain-containing protein